MVVPTLYCETKMVYQEFMKNVCIQPTTSNLMTTRWCLVLMAKAFLIGSW